MTTVSIVQAIYLAVSLFGISNAAPLPVGEGAPCEEGGSSGNNYGGSYGNAGSGNSWGNNGAGYHLGGADTNFGESCGLNFVLPCSGESSTLTVPAFDLPTGCSCMDCFPSMTLPGFTAKSGCTSLGCIPNIALPTGDLSGQHGGAIIGGLHDILGGNGGMDFILPCSGNSPPLTIPAFDIPSGCVGMDCFPSMTLPDFTPETGCTSCGCIPNIALPTGKLPGGFSSLIDILPTTLFSASNTASSTPSPQETGNSVTNTVSVTGSATSTSTLPCTTDSTKTSGTTSATTASITASPNIKTVVLSTTVFYTTVVTVSCTTC